MTDVPVATFAEQLDSLSAADRAQAVEDTVVAEFKAALFMAEDEELPLDVSFFELGLTSLMLTDVKQRLEILLGFGIGSSDLFNRPTVEQLVDYLIEPAAS